MMNIQLIQSQVVMSRHYLLNNIISSVEPTAIKLEIIIESICSKEMIKVPKMSITSQYPDAHSSILSKSNQNGIWHHSSSMLIPDGMLSPMFLMIIDPMISLTMSFRPPIKNIPKSSGSIPFDKLENNSSKERYGLLITCFVESLNIPSKIIPKLSRPLPLFCHLMSSKPQQKMTKLTFQV